MFISIWEDDCNNVTQQFIDPCGELGVPIAQEKMEWATNQIIFLGILIDGVRYCISVPKDKRLKAISELEEFVSKKKSTVKN